MSEGALEVFCRMIQWKEGTSREKNVFLFFSKFASVFLKELAWNRSSVWLKCLVIPMKVDRFVPSYYPLKKSLLSILMACLSFTVKILETYPLLCKRKKKRTSGVVALSVVGWTTVWSEHTIYSGLFPFLLVIPPLTDRKTWMEWSTAFRYSRSK